MNALDKQIGEPGQSHYTDMAIQPMEYSHKNGLGPAEHTVIKYVSRHKSKNGRQDIEKAIHTLELLLELEYGEERVYPTPNKCLNGMECFNWKCVRDGECQ